MPCYRSAYLAMSGIFFFGVTLTLLGLVIHSYYAYCDPFVSKVIKVPNQVGWIPDELRQGGNISMFRIASCVTTSHICSPPITMGSVDDFFPELSFLIFTGIQSIVVITWSNLARYYNTALRWKQQNESQTSNSQQTPHTSPSRASNGMSVMRIVMKL